MILLETERLIIQPLTPAQLHKYMLNDGSLEEELGLNYIPVSISPELAGTLEDHFLPLVSKHESHFYFFTLWVISVKAEKQMVGDVCFKGLPSEDGQVEIGYGTFDNHQGKSIMTEAIACLLDWCRTQPEIKEVLAETEAENLASERVLEKNHFLRYFQGPDNSWWKLKLN